MPSGTFSWASLLTITKGVTLKGNTTITGPPSNPTVTDATTIQDSNSLRSGSNSGIIRVRITPRQSFRLTGITFAPGRHSTVYGSNAAVNLASNGSSPNRSVRIDHCHFNLIYQSQNVWISGWVYGVADHNVLDCRSGALSFLIWHDAYGGTNQINGNGSWADYPWYGTDKFFFIEDNTIRGSEVVTSGAIDSTRGARFVLRHNAFNNAHPAGHGTEYNIGRGMRVYEVYDNTFNWTYSNPGGLQRSGTSMWHDNSWTGVASNADAHATLANYREISANGSQPWGPANGANPWDVNATERNGNHINGHPPYIYESGTDDSSNNSQGVVHDSTKSWAPNQWVGYSVTNTNAARACFGYGSYIISNTSNMLTYAYYLGDQGSTTLTFNSGDNYEIHKVLTQLDQNGRGKGDQITGAERPINVTTGRATWPHNALEPCYSWNNNYASSNHSLGFSAGGYPTNIPNRDYYNLGARFPADSTPPQVSSTYTAAVNGVDYTGTYIYPHPAVTGAPTPTPRATADSTRYLRKGGESKRKKLGKEEKPRKTLPVKRLKASS
jgi:hypothetical protein